MAKYTLMLRESGRAFANLSPSEMQAIFARYGAWSDGLRKAGTLGPSEKLTDGAGRVIRRTNGKVMVTDGPFTEGKEVLGGFFTIEAITRRKLSTETKRKVLYVGIALVGLLMVWAITERIFVRAISGTIMNSKKWGLSIAFQVVLRVLVMLCTS